MAHDANYNKSYKEGEISYEISVGDDLGRAKKKNAFMIQRQHVAEAFLDYAGGKNGEYSNKNVSVYEAPSSKKNTMGMMNKK